MGRRLENKVAIITGAGTGIGEAIAHKFAKEGAKVFVSGLPNDPIESVAKSITGHGGDAVTYTGDISQEFHAQYCVQRRLMPTDNWIS